jgi:hypothetical protein
VQQRVTREMNEILQAFYLGEEVWKAMDSIGDLKALGVNGIPAIFYKRFWGLIGERVKLKVLKVLNGGEMPPGWNDIIIVLIPKTDKPERLKDLRPISLCIVLYKLISKVVANQLKVVLPDVISPSQSAFVPGHLITDNVLLTYELTHYLKNKRKGVEGAAAIKLDMRKAYDRVEWGFLYNMMIKMGFRRQWTHLIMRYVSTVNYRIKVNGEHTDAITP